MSSIRRANTADIISPPPPPTAEGLLTVARSYYLHSGELLYAPKSHTFLSGWEIFDAEHAGKGKIDCSTYIHLILQGIPYEESPYVSGNAEDFFHSVCPWANAELLRSFGGKCSVNAPLRRAHQLAKYFWEKGLCREDRDYRPGDLLFFQVRQERVDFYLAFLIFRAISHIGIVAEDPDYLYESSGNQTEHVEQNFARPGIRRTPLSHRRPPLFYVRLCV